MRVPKIKFCVPCDYVSFNDPLYVVFFLSIKFSFIWNSSYKNSKILTLQTFPIIMIVWIDISTGFITGMPKAGNKLVILVIVDQLSKYDHFCALPHPFTPTIVAQVFLDQVFNLHGMPISIVSDHDPTFTRKFWQELFKL